MAVSVVRCDSMPFEPAGPCPVCGEPLDPLRAAHALAFEEGIVTVCGDDCASALRQSRKRGRRATPAGARPTPGRGLRGEELAQLHRLDPAPVAAPATVPWVTLALLAGAAGLALVPSQGGRAVALALVASTIGASAFQRRNETDRVSALVLEVIAVIALCAAALFDALDARYLLAAAAAGLVMTLRPWLVARGRGPVQSLANGLVNALPDEVRVPIDEVGNPAVTPCRILPARKVHSGDILLVREGDTLVVDGIVQAGSLTVLATADSLTPVPRGAGQPVLAGTRVVQGAASILATRVGDARALSRAASAPGSSRRLGRFGTLVSQPLVMAAYGLLVCALASLVADSVSGLLAALGVALLAYPRLGLTAGIELRAFVARVCAAQQGMVFRDATALEKAGRLSATALMADGTVTERRRVLTEVFVYGREIPLEPLISLAMGLQAICEDHPIARAFISYGHERGQTPTLVRRATHLPGRGITALAPEGESLAIGNRPLLLSAGVSVAVAERDAQAAEAAGRSAVFLSVGGRVRALFVIDYQIRPQARSALQTLIDLGADVALLSGDHLASVESFASKLDITHVKAEIGRDERAAEVARLRETGGLVAAIGRLPDDEAALAEADLSVAINGAGGAGGDIDLALASDDIADAARALRIAHVTHRSQQAVLWLCLGASAVASLGALSGLGPTALWPLLVLASEAWAVPPGEHLLARLRRVDVVGSVRPASP